MAVYFIRSGEHIKIGKSDNPWKRIATLQTGNPEPLEILAIAPGGMEFEAGLQEAFGSDCERGEWYRQSERLMAFISSIRVTFPNLQDPPQVALYQPPTPLDQSDTSLFTGDPVMGIGETAVFRLSHKGQFRFPRDPLDLWQVCLIYNNGYWKAVQNDEWRVMYAPGLRFHFENEQSFSITRVGEVLLTSPDGQTRQYNLGSPLNDAFRNAIYNRKNTASWLGVYNDEGSGITIAIRKKPYDAGTIRLDVPEEVIAHWRQYQYKSPLPEGVSIEA